MLIHLVQKAGGGHEGEKLRLFPAAHIPHGELGHPFPDGGGGVGQDADEGIVPARHGGEGIEGEAGGHGAQHKAVRPSGQDGGDLGHETGHHLGLDPQEDEVAGLGNFLVGGHPGVGQLGAKCLRLGGGAVGQVQDGALCRALVGGLGQGGAHIAGADETDLGKHGVTSLRKSYFLYHTTAGKECKENFRPSVPPDKIPRLGDGILAPKEGA